MSNVHNASQSAAAEPLLPSAKCTHVDCSTGNYTGLIDPATKNNYNFDLKSKNNTKNQISYAKAANKDLKFQKNIKISKAQKTLIRLSIYKEISLKTQLDLAIMGKIWVAFLATFFTNTWDSDQTT
ncbi:hypothetical protein BB561_003494, partial [Smittium simulii]